MIKIDKQKSKRRFHPVILLTLAVFLLAACGGDEPVVEEVGQTPQTDQTAVEELAEVLAVEGQPTWTAIPHIVEDLPDPTDPAPATSTPIPTSTTAPPTNTPEPTPTDTPEPTATAAPTQQPASQPTSPPAPPAEPTAAAEPVFGANLLTNGSFEEGHWNQNGIPELQLPNGWRIEWDEGPTGFGTEKWDAYVRPEARVLSTAFLPPEEHGLYIFDGTHTVKIFKGSGAVSFRLLTDVTLEPGTYVIEAKMFADIVQAWENRQKVWAADPTAAQFRFIVGDGGTNWTGQNYGQRNVHNWTFTIDEPKTITVGVWLRGKYAIANNGWFMDSLSLRRVE